VAKAISRSPKYQRLLADTVINATELCLLVQAYLGVLEGTLLRREAEAALK
jgi:hypothetical protein